ncbi:uncharacterized protein LOC131932992 [Physella acuta]|uniref:uncharacterized protein LOC131932992 n=1 Tax=Physella acuta TaxID=109671 RepID=UPI0027DE9CD3|nr:uncharacterized protein LOC131932992 [Physella acuta]
MAKRSERCPAGYYGRYCKQVCRCLENGCSYEGACLFGGGCVPGWFGENCLFRDVVPEAVEVKPESLASGASPSCRKTSHVHVVLKEEVFFTFLWLKFKGYYSGQLSLELSNKTHPKIPCLLPVPTLVRSTTHRVRCDNKMHVTRIDVTLDNGTSVCGVHVNGGRNLALGGRVHIKVNTTGEAKSNLDLKQDVTNQVKQNSCIDVTSDGGVITGVVSFEYPVTIHQIILHFTGLTLIGCK